MNAVFFDMDGTLIDSRADLAAAVNSTREALGLNPVPLESAVSFVGNGARYLLEHSIPEITGRFDEVWPMYRENYRKHMLDTATLYPGVSDTLAKLHDAGWKLGVVTNKPNFATHAILEHFGFTGYFGKAVVGGGDCEKMKPFTMPLLKAAEQIGHKLSGEDWMVGDNWTDMDCGNSAGIKTAFCTFGFGHLRQSTYTEKIDNFSELLRLCKIEK